MPPLLQGSLREYCLLVKSTNVPRNLTLVLMYHPRNLPPQPHIPQLTPALPVTNHQLTQSATPLPSTLLL